MEKAVIQRVPTAHLYVVNQFLDEVIPGMTAFDYRWHEGDFEYSDQEFLIDECTISENFFHSVYKMKPRYTSLIRSTVGEPKKNTLKTNLVTFENRNFNADRGCNVGPQDRLSDLLANLFFDTWVNSAKLKEVQQDILSVSKFHLGEWLEKRTPAAFKKLKHELHTWRYDPQQQLKYCLMVKSDIKPKLDESPLYKYMTGQNIIYHNSCVTAVFSHVFMQVVARLKYVLNDNICMFHGMDHQDFADEVALALGNINAFNAYELDISKYDKSQAALMKQVEEKILLRLGMHADLIDCFFCGEYDSLVTMRTKELQLSVGAQRRSGGANTWLGNTIIVMVLIAILLDGSKADFVGVCGDDSIIFSQQDLKLSLSDLATNYGFDVKLFNHTVPYFCSKYLVQTVDKLYFVPDPFKLFVKMGVGRTADINKLHEIFMSFVDMTKAMVSDDVIIELSHLHERRYGKSPMAYAAFCVIHVLRSNFSQFCRLYYDGDSSVGLVAKRSPSVTMQLRKTWFESKKKIGNLWRTMHIPFVDRASAQDLNDF